MASNIWRCKKICFFYTRFTQSLSKSLKNLPLVSMGQLKTGKGKAIFPFRGDPSMTVLDHDVLPDLSHPIHLSITGRAWPAMESEKELGAVFLLDLLQSEGKRWWTRRIFLYSLENLHCVYLCEFLWSEYCRAVITAVQFANNQQMWTAVSLWVMTFDGGIDFPRDAEIFWQLNLTPSLHVLSGQHLSGFVVRVALVAVTVFSSGHERDSGPQQQFFRYFSSWKYAHLWVWHFLLSSF